jgi:C1A family cysteine protease
LKFACALLFATIGLAAAVPLMEQPLFGESTYVAEWEKFVSSFEKSFIDEAEKLFRFSVFQRNFDFIHAYNRKSSGARLDVNAFADMTQKEFSSKFLGAIPTKAAYTAEAVINATVPTAVDWTTKGAVTPVKNQAQCGSCWAFSAVGAIEGAIFLAQNKLESLSEQQLVDCDKVDSGCSGGLMDNAFQYVEKNGLALESDYKYTGADGTCQSSKHTAAPYSKISGFKDVAQKNEAALKTAVASQPVSVAIEADTQVFQFYSSGVLDDAAGCGTQLDHGVLAVGYGTENGKDFWKIKNSWGASWGMSGYILLARTDSTSSAGMCGLASQPSYPTVSF